MLEDAGELCVIEVSFLVDRCLAEKLVDLLVCETVAHGGEELAKVVFMDKTFKVRRMYDQETGTNTGSNTYILVLVFKLGDNLRWGFGMEL